MTTTLLVFLPLLGFFLNGIYSYSTLRKKGVVSVVVSGTVGSATMIGSFALALLQFIRLKSIPGAGASIEEPLFTWIASGAVRVPFAFRFDALSSVFTLVITGVGSLIHVYSIGYMSDEGAAKYFAYLNLFCFMMLNLVLGATLPQVFLGWEGVGLASYLLIGFWSEDFAKVMAAQKAFLMNRVGDLGFLLAMFVAFKAAGTLDLLEVSRAGLAPAVATAFGLLIFFACTGKSAQIPLFTWLPDAMAGPTPVSALIHAATMVTSGIYLLTRLSPVISSSPLVMSVIAWTGAATALLAAVTACFQSDIKKVLAFSTISQLGFMFVACGTGGFENGVFHVMTHAFFKALLFLGAGSVIHALHGGQNIFKMGGLRKALPVTFITFTAGWAAILGLPPFSGFFSKDEIILGALHSPHGSPLLFSWMLLSAALTAFYMTRLYVLVFFGESRSSAKEKAHLHESPKVMTLPLLILSVLALSGGWFGAPVKIIAGEEVAASGSHWVMAVSVVAALIGAAIGWSRYSKKTKEEKVRDPIPLDRAYGWIFGKGASALSQGTGRFLEDGFFQGTIRALGAATELSGNLIRVFQSGSMQAYLLIMMAATLAVIGWFFFGVGGYGKF